MPITGKAMRRTRAVDLGGLNWVQPDLVQQRLDEGYGLPARFHTDPAIEVLEDEYIFKPSWQMACTLGDVREPGDFVTAQLGKYPVIVVRNEDNQLGAFLNVCSHRGMIVAEEREGNCKAFTCRYHGWRFGLDGGLQRAPGWALSAGGSGDTRRPVLPKAETLGLRPLSLDIWAGIVFVSIAPEQSLMDSLGELPELAQQVAYSEPFVDDEMTFVSEWHFDNKANWKAVAHQTMECYHCPTSHPKSLAPLFKLDDNNFRARVAPRANHISTSFRDGIRGVVGEDTGQELEEHVKRSGELPFQQLWGYPNTFLSFGIGVGVTAGRLDPLGPDASRLTVRYYARASEREMQSGIDALFDQVVSEDVDIIAKVQQGFRTGLIDPGPELHDREATVRGFDRDYWSAMLPAFDRVGNA
ncbi:aromatic ring-hydroxylating oxygenase subunit alpha [Nocardioides sp.]|uniref:aromatic ring-hydroxylating oxygenase subunit alpha n=1 Tax=Nocardioides sp. TaxID=35761 RepID=UPI003D0EAAA9